MGTVLDVANKYIIYLSEVDYRSSADKTAYWADALEDFIEGRYPGQPFHVHYTNELQPGQCVIATPEDRGYIRLYPEGTDGGLSHGQTIQ